MAKELLEEVGLSRSNKLRWLVLPVAALKPPKSFVRKVTDDELCSALSWMRSNVSANLGGSVDPRARRSIKVDGLGM